MGQKWELMPGWLYTFRADFRRKVGTDMKRTQFDILYTLQSGKQLTRNSCVAYDKPNIQRNDRIWRRKEDVASCCLPCIATHTKQWIHWVTLSISLRDKKRQIYTSSVKYLRSVYGVTLTKRTYEWCSARRKQKSGPNLGPRWSLHSFPLKVIWKAGRAIKQQVAQKLPLPWPHRQWRGRQFRFAAEHAEF